MKSQALLVLNLRQLALIFEEMDSVMEDESYHLSERMAAEEVRNECAELMGRDTPEGESLFERVDEGEWNRY